MREMRVADCRRENDIVCYGAVSRRRDATVRRGRAAPSPEFTAQGMLRALPLGIYRPRVARRPAAGVIKPRGHSRRVTRARHRRAPARRLCALDNAIYLRFSRNLRGRTRASAFNRPKGASRIDYRVNRKSYAISYRSINARPRPPPGFLEEDFCWIYGN